MARVTRKLKILALSRPRNLNIPRARQYGFITSTTREHGHLETFYARKFTKNKRTSALNVLKGHLFLLLNGLNPRVTWFV